MGALKRLSRLALCIRRRVSTLMSRMHTSVEIRPTAIEAAAIMNPAETAVAPKPASLNDDFTTTSTPTLPPCHPHFTPSSHQILPSLPSPPSTTHPASPFPHFATLPVELRLLIWHFASYLPRVLEIQYLNRTTGFTLASSPRGPAILQVCSEARHEALKAYTKCLGTKTRPRHLYANLASDILFFRAVERSHAWRCIRGPDSLWRGRLIHVRRIALVSKPSEGMAFLRRVVCGFPGLEELVLLWWDGVDGRAKEGRGVNFVEGVGVGAPAHVESAVLMAREYAVQWAERVQETWRAERWWEGAGRVRAPVVSVRHWCARAEGEW